VLNIVQKNIFPFLLRRLNNFNKCKTFFVFCEIQRNPPNIRKLKFLFWKLKFIFYISKKISKMTLGTKLRNLRAAKNESLEILAIKLEISKTAIGKWEADKAKPSIDNLMKICDYYETDVYKLLESVDNVNFGNAKFKGSSYAGYAQNFTVNHTAPELIESIVFNQKTITNLIQMQNELISKLLQTK
jgi:transcriptional regulator with XRE-family HTH domain